MRFFVTGATGFIGGHVVRLLRQDGHQVTAIARDPSKAKDLKAMGVDVQPGDVTDKESMRAPMGRADGVFHIAGWYKIGVRDKRPGQAVNIEGTRSVLELMAELGIRKGVYTSTLAVFGDTHGRMVDESYRPTGPWLTEYDRTKWVAHYEVAEPMMRRGLPLVIVQPGVTYGPGDTSEIRPLIRRYLQGKLRALPRDTAYCWGHVEDTARGHLLAMERGSPGESYIVAGEPHPLIDAFEVAEKLTGIPAPRFRLSPGVLRGLAALTRSERIRDVAGVTYLGSNAKARQVLGLNPRPFSDGWRETLEYEMGLLGMAFPSGS